MATKNGKKYKTKQDEPILVDGAIRDRHGRIIDRNYAKKEETNRHIARLTEDVDDLEYRLENVEARADNHDLEILELKHLIYETVVDHVEVTFTDVDVSLIPDYVDNHKVIDGGEIMLSEVLGKTEKWNQLVDAISIEDNLQWESESVTLSNGKATFTFSGNESARIFLFASLRNPINILSTHKYIFIPNISITNITLGKNVLSLRARKTDDSYVSVGDFNYDSKGLIFTIQDSEIDRIDVYQTPTTNSITPNSKLEYAPQIVDLTDIFGAGNEPTDVNSPEVQKLIAKAKAYPEYDAGSLHSVMAEDFKVNGANLCPNDGSVNHRFFAKGTRLYLGSDGTQNHQIAFLKEDGSIDDTWTVASAQTYSNPRPIEVINDCYGVKLYTDTYPLGNVMLTTKVIGRYIPYKAPFVLNFLQGNQLKTTETKTLGTLTLNADRGKLTMTGLAMASTVATIGNTAFKAGTYSYRIENPAGDTVGLYDITGDDWLFASSKPVLQGTFTLSTDKTIAMALDTRASTNYGGREINYMVAKGSEIIHVFKQGGITDPIELNGIANAHDKLIIEQQEDLSFNLVLERAMSKVDMGTLNWTYDNISDVSSPRFYTLEIRGIVENNTDNAINIKYAIRTNSVSSMANYSKCWHISGDGTLYIKDTSFTNSSDFKNSLNGVILIYKRANPTRETLITGLSESQVATLLEKGGTIEVGNEAMTLPDVKVWLEVRKLEA